jgi:hypothetical protein
MGEVVFRANVRGARRAGHQLHRAGRRLQTDLIHEMRGLAVTSTRTIRAYAPHRSGRLERGLQASVLSRGGYIRVVVRSTARSPEGFAYTDVTRFGHRKRWIYPKPPRKALRFYSVRAGKVIFARRVRGYRPSRDWMDPAAAAIEREASIVSERIGRRVVSGLG